jgi:regulator of protease activity HflC (stomatin/prohibitin superfamily)
MTFPYPTNPEEWQTTYTRDQAFRDSGKHASASTVAVIVGAMAVAIYIIIRVVPIIDFKKLAYPFYAWIIIAALLYLVCFLLLAAVQMGASRFAAHFFTEFYHPPDGTDPNTIINYRLYGKMKLPTPLDMLSRFEYIIIKDGEIDKKDKWAAWSARNLGGPILLTIFDGCALYLERGNRFSRVVGPGEKLAFLEWYETIKYVADLRPKVKTDSFDVWTKDGIRVKLTVRIECRIGDPAKKDPDSGLVYPYDPVAVKKAIERYSLRWPNPLEEPSEFTWIDAAWGQVTGIVPGYIGSRMLDDLLIADRKSGQILSPHALKELIEKLNGATSGFGVYITDFQIQKLDVPPKIYEQQKEYWKVERQSVETIIDGEAKAYSIRTREKARADAQRDIILAIADGLDKNPNKQFTESLLLSLSGILGDSLTDPLLRAYLARETLDTLEKLQKMLDRPNP